MNETETLRIALQALDEELSIALQALRIIAGHEQCIDNFMSNKDIAEEVLNRSRHWCYGHSVLDSLEGSNEND